MGLNEQYRWGGAKRYKSPLRNKEGERPSVQPLCTWWFGASGGEVRMVIIISIKKTAVHFEQLQLAPPNAPRPLTRAYIDSLRRSPGNVPPVTSERVSPE
ncbi:unnamed protein product [Penicillium camemberti]|uniref:Str. FM013 n=1 Tax=Penicillium camemberti (strain FM 013) TaxID=1429867 RepID=A0A0G4PHA5_PENC3|nr:unnamed protein product [Penicillium camemberti]